MNAKNLKIGDICKTIKQDGIIFEPGTLVRIMSTPLSQLTYDSRYYIKVLTGGYKGRDIWEPVDRLEEYYEEFVL